MGRVFRCSWTMTQNILRWVRLISNNPRMINRLFLFRAYYFSCSYLWAVYCLETPLKARIWGVLCTSVTNGWTAHPSSDDWVVSSDVCHWALLIYCRSELMEGLQSSFKCAFGTCFLSSDTVIVEYMPMWRSILFLKVGLRCKEMCSFTPNEPNSWWCWGVNVLLKPTSNTDAEGTLKHHKVLVTENDYILL